MTRIVPPPQQRLLLCAAIPPPGSEAALRNALVTLGPATPETDIEALWARGGDIDGAAIRRAFGHRAVAMQTGATPGDRLAMAFSERFFFHRTEKIVAIGVEVPAVSRELVDHAFALLDSCEWVVGPAQRGGYYLIGSRAATFDSDVFRSSGADVSSALEAALARIRAAGNSVALLPERSATSFFDGLNGTV